MNWNAMASASRTMNALTLCASLSSYPYSVLRFSSAGYKPVMICSMVHAMGETYSAQRMNAGAVAWLTKKLLNRMNIMRPGIATCSDSAWLGATAAMILKKFTITTKQMMDQKYSCPKLDHFSPLSAYMIHVVRKLPHTASVLFTAVSTMNDAAVLYSPSECSNLNTNRCAIISGITDMLDNAPICRSMNRNESCCTGSLLPMSRNASPMIKPCRLAMPYRVLSCRLSRSVSVTRRLNNVAICVPMLTEWTPLCRSALKLVAPARIAATLSVCVGSSPPAATQASTARDTVLACVSWYSSAKKSALFPGMPGVMMSR